MITYHVGITTYDRPKRLHRLLMQLKQQRGVRMDTYVYNDGPVAPDMLDGQGVNVHTTKKHLGKEGYWRLFSKVWNDAANRQEKYDYFLFVQDDVSLDKTEILYDAGQVMEKLKEEVANVAALNLYGDGPQWAPIARWTGRPVVELASGWIYASWLDLQCVVFDPLVFKVMPAILKPRHDDTVKSSGVGRQISLRLDDSRCAQIMAPEPVVEHKDGGRSKMHPERDMSDPYPDKPIRKIE